VLSEHKVLLGKELAPDQRVHRIFFATILNRTSTIYGYLDTGADRSCVSRAILAALAKHADCPVVVEPCTVRLVGWFGSQSNATSEATLFLKIGKQEEKVKLLVVDDLDYGLVIGNDIFRNVFQCGIKEGQEQFIRLKCGAKVPYCRSVDPVQPDAQRRVPIQIAEHHVVPARSVSHVRVFLPPYTPTDPIFAHQLGIVDPDDSFTKRKLYLPPHLVKPLRIMRLIVINSSPKRVKLTIGDTCGYYQPLIQQDLIQGHEARVLALQVREEVRRMHRLKAEAADVPTAASPASPAPLDETDSPPPGTVKTDVRGQLDPGTEGVAFDDRMELPLNTPQDPPDIDPAFPAHLRQKLVDTI